MRTIVILLLMCGVAFVHDLQSDDWTSINVQPTGVWSVVANDGSHTHYVDGTEVSETIYDAAKVQRVADSKDFEINLPKLEKAVFLTMFDLVNATRVSAGQSEITKATFKENVVTKYDTL